MTEFMRFWRDQSGATAIEYGLIAAGISVAIITVVASLGSGRLQRPFDDDDLQSGVADPGWRLLRARLHKRDGDHRNAFSCWNSVSRSRRRVCFLHPWMDWRW